MKGKRLANFQSANVPPRTLILLWLLLIGLFASYGFFGPGHHRQIHGQPFSYSDALESALIYGGIGFTLSTCLSVILYAAQKLSAKAVSRFRAIAIVFSCSALAAIMPPMAMASCGRFGGENTLAIADVTAYTFGIGIVSFVLFDIGILILHFQRRST